ncbi:MAG: amidase [Polyangiaceae bacterium]
MLRSPRISGAALRSLANVAASPVGATLFHQVFRRDLGIGRLEALPQSLRAVIPQDASAWQARPPRTWGDESLPVPTTKAWSGTTETYTTAYRSGAANPVDVVTKALEMARGLARRSPSVGPLMEYADGVALDEAEASRARYAAKKAKGPFDGVPYVVKEQTGVVGFKRQAGTTFLDASRMTEDATLVARLRAEGAICLGISPMTEYGMSPVGFNPQRTMPRNPHATSHPAGGSSTGSGVAVATGLAPFAIGADGGGSIRIPAAANGVFGIKPTWGRVTRAGDVSIGTVEHLGPLASSTLDLARVLEVIGPTDPKDKTTRDAPPIPRGSLEKALARGVRGARIGVPESEWADADDEVQKACWTALRALEKDGAVLVPVKSDLTPLAAVVGYLDLGVGASSLLYPVFSEKRHVLGPDLQVTIAAIAGTSAVDYLDGLRLRAGLRKEMQRILGDVDLYAIPTLAKTPPKVTDAEFASGFVDPFVLAGYVRYTFLANLTGLPAGTAPVGRDRGGLPIGFQLVGDAWDDASVLAGMAHLERVGIAKVEEPSVSVHVLPG